SRVSTGRATRSPARCSARWRPAPSWRARSAAPDRLPVRSRAMDFDMPGEDDPRRLAVRVWLAEHPSPSNAELHEAGYVVPHWPAPYGLDADPMHQLIIDDELKRGGVTRTPVSSNPIGVGWAAPTIYLAGSDWQKERFLDPIFTGEEL